MALNETHRIIWLDAYIGEDGEYHSFKRMFVTTLDRNSQFGNEYDMLICAVNTNAVPFIFVDTCDKAIHEININHDKQIIFISSGSLGKQIIPSIISKYPHVYSFYIFCAIMENYVDFAYEYLDRLQIFTSELDLLIRLVRDISWEMIERGKSHLMKNNPDAARNYFQRSCTLELAANEKDKPSDATSARLRLLNGENDNIGLIKEAENLKQQQDREREEQQAEPFIPDHDSKGHEEGTTYQNQDSPMAEEELIDHDSDLNIAEQVALEEHQGEMQPDSELPIVPEILLIEQ